MAKTSVAWCPRCQRYTGEIMGDTSRKGCTLHDRCILVTVPWHCERCYGFLRSEERHIRRIAT